MATTLYEEFEDLLEAQWAGQLNESGQERLAQLCVGDPALAERLIHENGLTGLLSRCGPNPAPEGLAASVLGRIEREADLRPKSARTGGREASYSFRGRWWQAPAMRWAQGLALTAMLVVLGAALFYQHRQLRQYRVASEPSLERGRQTVFTAEALPVSEAAPTASISGDAPASPITPAESADGPRLMAQVVEAERAPAASIAAERNDQGASRVAEMTTPDLPTVVATPLRTEPVNEDQLDTEVALADLDVGQEESPPPPVDSSEEPAATPVEVKSRRLAMQIQLAADHAALPSQSPAAGRKRTVAGRPNDPRGQGKRRSFAENGAAPTEPAKRSKVTLKDIEMAAAMAGGEIAGRAERQKNVHQLSLKMDRDQVQTFMEKLEEMGVPYLRKVSPRPSEDEAPDSTEPPVQFFDITEGQSILKSVHDIPPEPPVAKASPADGATTFILRPAVMEANGRQFPVIVMVRVVARGEPQR